MKISKNMIIGIVIGLVVLLFIVSVSIVPCKKNNELVNTGLKEKFNIDNNFLTNLNKLKTNLNKKAEASSHMIDQQRQDKVIFDTFERLNCINRVMGGSKERCS